MNLLKHSYSCLQYLNLSRSRLYPLQWVSEARDKVPDNSRTLVLLTWRVARYIDVDLETDWLTCQFKHALHINLIMSLIDVNIGMTAAFWTLLSCKSGERTRLASCRRCWYMLLYQQTSADARLSCKGSDEKKTREGMGSMMTTEWVCYWDYWLMSVVYNVISDRRARSEMEQWQLLSKKKASEIKLAWKLSSQTNDTSK